jgi:hypothetical protein
MGSPYAGTGGGRRPPGASARSTGGTDRSRRVRSHQDRIPHARRALAYGSRGDTRRPWMGIATGRMGGRRPVAGLRAMCGSIRVVAGARRTAGRGPRGVCRSAERGAGPGPSPSRGVGPCQTGQRRVPSRCRGIAHRGRPPSTTGEGGALGRSRPRSRTTPWPSARTGGIGQRRCRDDQDDRGG